MCYLTKRNNPCDYTTFVVLAIDVGATFLKQNCESFIRIQYVGNKNKPLSRASNGQPLGLGNVSAEALKSISL